MNILTLTQYCRFIAAIFLFFLPHCLGATSTEDLIELDKIKTENFIEFSEGLEILERNMSSFTDDEIKYFNFLKLYRQMYLTGYRDSTTEIESMLATNLPLHLTFRLKALAVNSHILTKDLKKAFIYADDILNTLNSIQDPFTLRQVLAPMANLFIDVKQKDIANFYIQRLLEVSEDVKAKCFAHFLLFKMNYEFLETNEMPISALKAIDSCNASGESLWRDLVYVVWAKVTLDSNDVEKAGELIRLFSSNAKESNYPLLIAMTYAVEAMYQVKTKEIAAAKETIKLAFGKAQFNDSNEALLWAYELAYKLYESEGNYKLAYENFIKYNELSYKLIRDRADKQLSYQLVKSEIEAKNQRIALLNKDNELLFLQKNVIEQEVRQTRVLMAVLAVVLSIAVYLAYKGLTGRHRFKKIAEFDQLTGISNRYHFNNQAELALEFCQKNNQPAAVILFDLDHFKQINDNHGHAAGDWALQAVVGTCRHFMRNNDVFGRIGGEEFAVVLPGCQTDKAALLAEICRDAIAAIDTEESGTAFPLTASFGVSGSNTSGYQLKQLLADADKAMYRAKDGGRDQVVSFAEA